MIFNKDKYTYVDHMVAGKEDSEDKTIREIIAFAPYNGKTYHGAARCHPDDEFNPNIGEELAARRCDLAIRKARLADRRERVKFYEELISSWQVSLEKAEFSLANAEEELEEATKDLANLYTRLGMKE